MAGKMISKEGLLAMVSELQEKRKALAGIDKKIDEAKQLVESAGAMKKAANEAFNAAYQHLVDEVGEELAKMLDSQGPAKSQGTSTGDRMTKTEKETNRAKIVDMVKKAGSAGIGSSAIVKGLAEEGKPPRNISVFLAGMVDDKLIAGKGERKARVYIAK